MFRSFAKASLLASLAAIVAADFSVISPGGDGLWWVADSQNTLVWSCDDSPPATEFTVLLNNPSILTSPLAIDASVPNADCSFSITSQQATLTPATNYTVILANVVNSTDIYATSQPFEVKALGASFPAASATPTGSNTASGSSSATGSATSSSSTTSGSSTSGAAALHRTSAWAVAALGVVGGAFALL